MELGIFRIAFVFEAKVISGFSRIVLQGRVYAQVFAGWDLDLGQGGASKMLLPTWSVMDVVVDVVGQPFDRPVGRVWTCI